MDCVRAVCGLLRAVHFVSNIFFPKYPLTLFPLLSIVYYVNKSKHKRFVIRSVPGELVGKMVSSRVLEMNVNIDIDTCILVNSNTMNKLCGHTNSWLKLIKYKLNEQGIRTVTSCIVRVIGIQGVESGCMITSETSHFNIKGRLGFDSDLDKLSVWAEVISFKPDGLTQLSRLQFEPRMASKASISLMQSPVDVDPIIIDVILGNYFESPHYLHVDDLFCINIFESAPHLQYSAFITAPIIFFKVVQVEGPAYDISGTKCGHHIQKEFTTLRQSTNQQGYLPPMCTFLVGKGAHTAWLETDYKSLLLSNCPFGLEDLYNELLTSFRPFLYFDQHKMQGLQPVFLISGPKGAGKRKVITAVAKALGLNEWAVDCLELKGNTPGYTEGKLKFIFKKVMQFVPCIIVMRNIDALCTDNDRNEDTRVIGTFHDQMAYLFREKVNSTFPILLVGTCNNNSSSDNMSSVTPGLARAFLHVINVNNPNETQRVAMLSWIIKRNNLALDHDVLLTHLAARCSGFLYEDLKALVSHAFRIQYKHLKTEDTDEIDQQESRCLKHKYFENALEVMYGAYSDAIGAPKIPSVCWSDIGGLALLKDEITRTITMPLQHPALVASGLRRSGILLYGPPGTGKTLLAKAVATECNLNFLSVKGPELLNMYVGQSEENVREVFQRARAASPCIIFFDELDSLAPNRGKSGDSGGVMDRVVSQLLAEMDGMQKSSHLYVIGATNRPDLIDPALLRPGRFDKLLYVGVCEDSDAQLSVMAALTRKFDLDSDVSLSDIVALLPTNLTGADLFSVCSNAWRNAAKRVIQIFENGRVETPIVPESVVVTSEDFRTAAVELTPSVSPDDLNYFRQLHQKLVSS